MPELRPRAAAAVWMPLYLFTSLCCLLGSTASALPRRSCGSFPTTRSTP